MLLGIDKQTWMLGGGLLLIILSMLVSGLYGLGRKFGKEATFSKHTKAPTRNLIKFTKAMGEPVVTDDDNKLPLLAVGALAFGGALLFFFGVRP